MSLLVFSSEVLASDNNGYKRVVRTVSLTDSTGTGGQIGIQPSSYNPSQIQLSINTSASVGRIPYSSDVTSSGAQTYTVPIAVLEDAPFSPDLSLVYNSQGGQGIAGYGWSIGGISTITVVPKNSLYHGEVSPASASDTSSVYMLDGSMLIPCTDQNFIQAGYQYQTEAGRVMVKVTKAANGHPLFFQARYPDGSSSTYGFWADGQFHTSYPIMFKSDRFDNTIEYNYNSTYHSDSGNYTYTPSTIKYGFVTQPGNEPVAHVDFEYANETRDDVTPLYYGGQAVSESSLLIGIVSTGFEDDTLWRYSLAQQTTTYGDVVLTEIGLHNKDNEFLNPLRFYYGSGINAQALPSPDFIENRAVFNSYGDIPEEPEDPDPDDPDPDEPEEPEDPYIYDPNDFVFRRGKFKSASYEDGLIFYEKYRSLAYGYPHYYSSLFYAPCVDSLPNAGLHGSPSRFFLAEPIDIDNDGVDEIVQLRFSARTQSNGHYYVPLITSIISYDETAGELQTVRQFTLETNAYFTRTVSGNTITYVLPHYVCFGDFVGNGRLQMLRINSTTYGGQPTSGTIPWVYITDMLSGEDIYHDVLDFSYDEDATKLIAQDVDGDGRSELCFATANTLKIYHFRHSYNPPLPDSTNPYDGWRLTLDKSVSIPTAAFSERTLAGDFNSDGLLDLLIPPGSGVEGGTLWTEYSFNGESFIVSSDDVSTYMTDDRFVIQDLNRDGLPDILRQRGSVLSILLNDKGMFSSDRVYDSSVALSDSCVVLPCNSVRFREIDDCVLLDRDTARVYRFNQDRGAERLLTASADSYRTLATHSYSDITADWAYGTDRARTLTVDTLYHKRRFPLMVVDSTSVCAWTPARGNIPNGDEGSGDSFPLTLLSSNSYRYKDAVLGSMGLGFRGFGEVTVTDNIPDGGMLDIRITTYDPEMAGMPVGLTSSKQSILTGQTSVYSSTVNTYDNRPVTGALFNPVLTSSEQNDLLTGIRSTTTLTYDSFDAPILRVTTWSLRPDAPSSPVVPGCFDTTDSVRTEYLHSNSAYKYFLSLPTREVTNQSYDSISLFNDDGSMIIRDSIVTTYDNVSMLPVRRERRRQTARYRRMSQEEPGWTFVQSLRTSEEVTASGDDVGSIVSPVGTARGGGETGINAGGLTPGGGSIIIPIDTAITRLAVARDDVLLSDERWTYDSMGNVLTAMSSGPDGVTFTGNSYTYDSTFRHMLTHTDALGRTQTYGGYNNFGKPTTITDNKGRTTTVAYDSWSRETSRTLPDGTVESHILQWDISAGGDNSTLVLSGNSFKHNSGSEILSLGTRYSEVTTVTGSPSHVTRYNALEQKTGSYEQAFDGLWRGTSVRYDIKGRQALITRPNRAQAFADTLGAVGASDTLVVFTYDCYSRPSLRRETSGRQTTWSYSGRSTTRTEDGITHTSTVDERGREARVDDASGHLVYYHTGGGLLRRISVRISGTDDYSGTEHSLFNTYTNTKIYYDAWGERSLIIDPCSGEQRDTTTYNTDGSRTLKSVSEKGSTFTTVDKYGRVLSEVRAPSASASTLSFAPIETVTYVYDDDTAMLSQLGYSSQAGDGNNLIYESVTAVSPPGGPSATISYKHYTYDALDRISSTKENAPGNGRWFRQEYTYSQIGSTPQSVSFTAGASAADVNGSHLGTECYSYAYGHRLSASFIDANAAPGSSPTIIWQQTSENDYGQVTGGVSGPLTRTYEYDAYGLPSGRVIASTLSPSAPVQSYSYVFDHATGNLTSRGDTVHGTSESFSYGTLGQLISSSYTASANGGSSGEMILWYDIPKGNILNKINEVSSIYSDSSHPYTLTSAQDLELGTIHYPADLTIVYNAMWHPHLIAKSGVKATFAYGTNGRRVRMEVRDSTVTGGTTTTVRYYLGDGRYEVDSLSTILTQRLYLMGDAYSAPAVYVDSSLSGSTNSQILFIGRDYQGSITELIGEDGTLLSNYSYDPWGRPRNAQTLVKYTTGSAPDLALWRGYTGHEWLPWFSLYNCNARLYDPLLGRFLEPDPYIQAPDFTQNFNRHAYCLNNPMKYSDQSGMLFGVDDVIIALFAGAIIGAYSGGVIANEGQYNPTKWDWKSKETYRYIIAGGFVGGLSALGGYYFFSSCIPFANTAAIADASFTNSIGTWFYTGGKNDIIMGLGVVSYNFTQNEWGYIGKKGNSNMDNIAYLLGTLSNLTDLVSVINGGGQNINVNSEKTSKRDWWGHSSITSEDGSTMVSVGPNSPVQKEQSLADTWNNSIKQAVNWPSYYGEQGTWSIELMNVSTNVIRNYASNITRWDLLLNSCVGHTTRALWLAGVPTLYLFHPHLLNIQLLLRQIGIYASPYLYQL